MERDGQRRRSPRISALDCKENHQKRAARTRMMKRKVDDDDDSSTFSPVSKLAKQVWKGRDCPQNADNSTDFLEWKCVLESHKINKNQKCDDHAITNGKQSTMPAKHILELVLDTLQRRDSYEIFAEPVDPDEVEEYYEIIQEPMDFGTMRAKLHEGLYQNLQQFEHDVFLIPENAMHFNSSTTIYFRQARAIHDLAKKVLHVLKTDPDNFVSEFSGTRRRSMRKALSESKLKDSRFTTPKSGDVCSTSTFRKTNKKSPVLMIHHFNARNFSNGSRESTGLLSDRRLTFSCDDKMSVWKPDLILMNQGETSYKDSLMSYVKGLGPTAEKVAKRKLLGQHEEANKHRALGSDKCHPTSGGFRAKEFSLHRIGADKCPPNSGGIRAKDFKTFRDFTSGANPFLAVIDLTKDGEAANCSRDKKGKEKSEENKGKEKSEENKGKEKSEMMKRVAFPVPVGRELSCSTSKSNDDARPVILALENPSSAFKSRIKRNALVSNPSQQPPPLPIVSRFTFDLPFLKARLSQMNAAASGKLRC